MIDINKLKRRLLLKYEGFATIIANMNFIENDSILSNGHPTAATDGMNFVYHPDFMNNLTEDEQLSIIAHEISHIANNHIKRGEGKDPKIWNIACDAVVNANLKKDGLKLPIGCVDMPDAINYDTETLYNALIKDRKNDQSNSQDSNKIKKDKSNNENNSNNNSYDNDKNDVGYDSHKLWEEAIKKSKDINNNSDDKENDVLREIEKIQENNTKDGEKKVFKENRKKRLENLKKLREDLVSKSCGNTTSSNTFKMSDIGEYTQVINWTKLLRECINSKVDWTYKNATIEEGVLTPHIEELQTSETEILLDTSGSIDDDLLKNFLRECKGIIRTSKIKVGCFDTEFYGFKVIKNEQDINNMDFIGRGGTDFNVAVNAFTKRVDNKIIFTDGCAPMPQETMDIIWVVYGNYKISPKGGKVIYIDDNELNKLQFNGYNR